MVVLSDNKTDYGSFGEPSQILVVSGSGGQGAASTVVLNRNPANILTNRSVHSSSQSLGVNSINSSFGQHSSNNNLSYVNTNSNNSASQSIDSISAGSGARGGNQNLGLGLALGLVSAANSGVNLNVIASSSGGAVRQSQGSGSDGGSSGGGGGGGRSGSGNSYSNSSSPMSTNSGELLYQRQPLLQECKNGWGNGGHDDIIESSSEKRNGSVVRIDMPSLSRDGSMEDGGASTTVKRRIPKERRKTLIAFVFLFCNFILATISLALTHERLPDRETTKPLPDIVLDNVNVQDWALDVSEILIIISTVVTVLIMVCHEHRWIVFRRAFMILGILYFMRSVTMYVTVLPVASYTYYCSPKANTTSFLLVAKRVIQLVSGFGLSINGQQTFCGDYIYSGHTVILVSAYLFIKEYTSKRLYVLHWASFLASTTGIVMVLIARGHYTIDVLVAYYVSTRVFWIYHTMAHNAQLKTPSTSNYLSRIWWYPLFRYLEGKVGVLPPSSGLSYSWIPRSVRARLS